MSKEYSFCESVTATSISPWCIRPLTEQGKRLSGGIDTPSLCGRVKERMGWDLQTPVNLGDPRACRECKKVLSKLNGGTEFPNAIAEHMTITQKESEDRNERSTGNRASE